MADALALANVLYEKNNGIAYITLNRPCPQRTQHADLDGFEGRI